MILEGRRDVLIRNSPWHHNGAKEKKDSRNRLPLLRIYLFINSPKISSHTSTDKLFLCSSYKPRYSISDSVGTGIALTSVEFT